MSVNRAICLHCQHFRNTPEYLENAIPGLKVMSSGMASVRADDGLCLKRDVYLAAYYSCDQFERPALEVRESVKDA
ncbi:hypothetical protein [Thiolapillus sp.]